MNKMIGLPIEDFDTTEITPENTIIDMNKLNFPVDIDKQNDAALLYIRNTGINATFSFDNCSYETKSWFLIRFLKKKNFELNMKSLVDTWIHIIANGYFNFNDLSHKSILDIEEINKFNEENKDYIFEIRRFIVSLPLVSINYFKNYITDNYLNEVDISEFDCSQYEKSSFNMINMSAFIYILKDPSIITLQQVLSDHIEPIWYTEYFDNNDNNAYFSDLINSFPYLNILNLFTPDNEMIRELFIDKMNNYLNSQIKTSNEDEID